MMDESLDELAQVPARVSQGLDDVIDEVSTKVGRTLRQSSISELVPTKLVEFLESPSSDKTSCSSSESS